MHPSVTTPPIQRCTRCVYTADTPAILFNAHGICNYCSIHDDMERQYPNNEKGRQILETIAKTARREGRGKPYDVIVGLSGGTDSSYLLWIAKELHLRPLAVHFDNTWNSAIAAQNMSVLLSALNIPLETYVVNNTEYDEICRAFLRSGVRDFDIPNDIALAAVLYKAAEKHGIRTIFEGHSFRTEGIAPLGWTYMDGKYIESVVKEYAAADKRTLQTFPTMKLLPFLRWTAVHRIRKIRPLYYVDYNKANAQRFLSERFGWQNYGGHHLENRISAFYHSYLLTRRYGVDMRSVAASALVRSGQLKREEAIAQLNQPQHADPQLVKLIQERLEIDDALFEELMNRPHRTHRDFKTYKQTFVRLRPLFKLLAHFELVPRSFYLKYTAKNDI